MEMLQGKIVKCILQRPVGGIRYDEVVQCIQPKLCRQNNMLSCEITVVDLFAPQDGLCFLPCGRSLVEVEGYGVIEVSQRILRQEVCTCASDKPLEDRHRQTVVLLLNGLYHLQHAGGFTGTHDRVKCFLQIAVAQKVKIEIDKGLALHVFVGLHFPWNDQRILYQVHVDWQHIENTYFADIEQEVLELLTCFLEIRRILRHVGQAVDELIEECSPHRVHSIALSHKDWRGPLRPSYLESLVFKRLIMEKGIERLGEVFPRTHVFTVLNTPTTTVFDRAEPPFKESLRYVFQHFYPCLRLEIIPLHIVFVRSDALYDLALVACQKALRTLQTGVEHGRAPLYNVVF